MLNKVLTRKQEAFVAEYLIDLNGAQAAIRAGYSEHRGTEQAYELLRIPAIAALIERGKAQRLARVNMQQDTVLHELSLLSHSCLDHYIVDDNGQVTLAEGAPQGAMRAVQSIKRWKSFRTDKDGQVVTHIEVELKLWDKVVPLRLMGRHVGLFPDRVEYTGTDGGPIELVTLTAAELADHAEAIAIEARRIADEEAERVVIPHATVQNPFGTNTESEEPPDYE